ncbi:hypothetical protein DBV15_09973 [Temnothorax longispinosus]|uniref:Uncharacterized protein n=1 Tax=Temnothorax longispinosus TaxID=300112 RepID=A0A4S2KSE8_9HYME|nr:hypothetical protein DBV15_09973 [Temnothorax longispinosus]
MQNRIGRNVLHDASRCNLFTLQRATPRARATESHDLADHNWSGTLLQREREAVRNFPSAGVIARGGSGHARRKNAAKKEKRNERAASRGINAVPSSRVEPSRAHGGSDESATHLAIVPDRSSRGDRERDGGGWVGEGEPQKDDGGWRRRTEGKGTEGGGVREGTGRELVEGGGGWFKQWWEWAELRRVMTP